MTARQTAGELSLKAAGDKTIYDPLEVSHGVLEDIPEQLKLCAERHNNIINEDEYFIGIQFAEDCAIKGITRMKFWAFPHMPKPRPRQTVFLYNKIKNSFQRLWSLPNALVMAQISEMPSVSEKWKLTKMWSDAFFTGWDYEPITDKWVNKKESHFFDVIRNHFGISHLSEKEFLNANRHELVKACNEDVDPLFSDTFDFSKIDIKQVVDSGDPVLNKS